MNTVLSRYIYIARKPACIIQLRDTSTNQYDKACTFIQLNPRYENILSSPHAMFVLQVSRMRWRPRTSVHAYNHAYQQTASQKPSQPLNFWGKSRNTNFLEKMKGTNFIMVGIFFLNDETGAKVALKEYIINVRRESGCYYDLHCSSHMSKTYSHPAKELEIEGSIEAPTCKISSYHWNWQVDIIIKCLSWEIIHLWTITSPGTHTY